MARIKTFKNFVTPVECAELNAWVEQGVMRRWLDLGRNENAKRLTTRMYGERFVYPNLAYKISKRICNWLSLSSAQVVEGHGKDGIVVSYTLPGGDVYPHQDPPPQEMSALRCNVVTQSPDDGGELFVDGQHIPLEAGELHCYLASEHTHYVTEVKGETPRILWMFGFCVLADEWESGKTKTGEFA